MSDYPTEGELRKIGRWPFGDMLGLIVFVESIWHFGEWGWHQRGRTFHISTGEWSGNEDIIDAMAKNFIFWSQCFVQHRRGGHYVFHVRRSVKKKP